MSARPLPERLRKHSSYEHRHAPDMRSAADRIEALERALRDLLGCEAGESLQADHDSDHARTCGPDDCAVCKAREVLE